MLRRCPPIGMEQNMVNIFRYAATVAVVALVPFAAGLNAADARSGGGSGSHIATTNTNKSNTVASSDKSKQDGSKVKGKTYLKYKLDTVFTTK
jgi:hypothetical protein